MAFQLPPFPFQFANYSTPNGFAINVPLQFGTTATATGFEMPFVTIGFANYPIYQGFSVNVPVQFGIPETRTGFQLPIIYPKGLGGTPPLVLIPPPTDFSLDMPTPMVVIPHLSAISEPFNFELTPQIPSIFATFQTTSPTVAFDLTLENPTVHAGANLFFEPMSFDLDMPPPTCASAQIISIPSTDFNLDFHVPTVHAGANLYPPSTDFNLEIQTPNVFATFQTTSPTVDFDLTLQTPNVFATAVVNVPTSAFDLGMPPPRIVPFVPSLAFDLALPTPTVVVSFISTADPHAFTLDMPAPTVEIVVEKAASFEVACRQSFVRAFKFGCEKTVEKSVAFPFRVLDVVTVERMVSFEFSSPVTAMRSLTFGCEKTVEKSVAFPFGMVVQVEKMVVFPFSSPIEPTVERMISLPFVGISKPAIFVVSEENYAIHQGQRVDLLDYMISQDWDTYLWTGQMSIANYQDYARMHKNDAVTLVLQGVDYTLVIQNRSHSDDGNNGQAKFTIDVASPTVALSDKNLKISKTWGAVMASVAAQAIVEQPIDWQIVDWLLPAGRLSYENTNPMELLRKLVDAAGGIVQTTREGSLKVQYKTPCAFNKLSEAAIDFTFSDTAHLFNYDERTPSGEFYNAAIITDTDNAIDRQWSGEYVPTDDVSGVLRVYGQAWLDPAFFEVTTTGNPTIEIGQGVVVYIEENQTLEFKKGQASTSYPVFILRECVWKYADLGELMWELDSPQLKTAAPSYSVAELKYTRRVVDFPIRHNVQDLETSQFLIAEYVD